jgi:cellulose synthase/poly-beta-1,6-N-acetylglucosamine synthase-like glycosyltransferase
MIILFLTLAISALAYLLVSLYLSQGLYRLSSSSVCSAPEQNGEEESTISLIIAARNEEKSLPHLFDSLIEQSYPENLFTITVVNDRSSDGTREVIESYKSKLPNLNSINIEDVPEGSAPKKHAITQGVLQTKGDIILITDADCIVPSRWIESVANRFRNPAVGLVQGLTGYASKRKNNILNRFQTLDFFSHSVVAAAGIGRNVPINSNANNFAYRRSIFNSLEGYGDVAHVVSGDDDLLLQRVWEQKKWKIDYLATPEAAVVTEAPETFGEMIEQRKRWGSKTVYYKPKQVALLSTIFLFYLLTLLSVIATPLFSLSPVIPFTLYGVKILGELLFLLPGTALFGKRELRRDIWWASFFQLLLVIYSVLGGVFGTFSWKGQSFNRSLKK